MERINFDDIAIHPDSTVRQRKLLEQMDKCKEGVLITDCLANDKRGGLQVMQILQKTKPNRRYKIRVLKDMWGDPVKPGDTIEWHFATAHRDPFGKKITNAYKKDLIRRGAIREIETWHDATVDKHGCIDVPFEDAAILLNTRGVHFESKEPLCRMKETASPSNKRLQHYWLYEEVPPWEYEKLNKPKRKKQSTTKTNDPVVAGRPTATETDRATGK